MPCHHCSRPETLHCPGCGACWPDDACSLSCEADPAEIDEVLAAIDDWEGARVR